MAEPILTGQQIIFRAIRRTFLSLVLVLGAVYCIDYAILRFRMATNRNATATVSVRPVYAVPQKNRSTEYLLGDLQDQTCVNALFPHLGHSPCWYLKNHKEQRINI